MLPPTKLFFVAAALVFAACSSNADPSVIDDDRGARDVGVDEGAGADAAGGDVAMQDLGGARIIASITLDPTEAAVSPDETVTFAATILDDTGARWPRSPMWSSSTPSVLESLGDGVFVARMLGTATVRAEIEGREATAEVVVVPTPVARIEVVPANRTMEPGDEVQLLVSAFDGLNAPIEDDRSATFASSNDTVVTVTEDGLVTAVGGGMAEVTTSVEGIEATSRFNVLEAGIDRIEVTPTTSLLSRGETVQLMATAFIENVEQPDVTFTWTSSAPGIAAVDADGLVEGLAEGTSVVSAEVGGMTASATINVTFDFEAISAGGAHACGLVKGVAYCWGDDSGLALGHTAGRGPALVQTDLRFTAISAGGRHTCAIDTAGKMWCWGRGDEGQRGDGSTISTVLPSPVSGNHVFDAVATGEFATCGVENGNLDGELCCWGQYGGRTNLGPVIIGPYPSPAMGMTQVCGIQSGDAFCFGDNTDGQIGVNMFGGSYTDFQAVTGGFTFDHLAAGAKHTCGITTGGATLCWGNNDFGQIGDGTTTPRATPILVSTTVGLSRLSAGDDHNCALSVAGTPYCWGSNAAGQLGTGMTGGTSTTPTSAVTQVVFSTLSAGANFTCGVSIDGDPHCWGDGALGQLGPGGSKNVPTKVTGF